MPGGLLSCSQEAYIAWRAGRLRDPVARLRFLRWAGRKRNRWARRSRRILTSPAVMVVAAGLLVPAGVVAPPNLSGSAAADAVPAEPPAVWLVRQTRDYEVFSNGLRIERAYECDHIPRKYRVYDRSRLDEGLSEERITPAGILYHTTESHLVPFGEPQNARLQRAGEAVLDYVRANRFYHFVIDRFGRVFRVVKEDCAAYHSGHSMWADEKWVYVGLNQAFLGVAFETRSERPELTPAQLHSGRNLTDLLRVKYPIPAGNCVAHAQASINPRALLIGYHTDWAAGLPYRELGLPDNYAQRIPSAVLFGFAWDDALARSMGQRPWAGLLATQEEWQYQASRRRVSLRQYLRTLQERYRKISGAARPAPRVSQQQEVDS